MFPSIRLGPYKILAPVGDRVGEDPNDRPLNRRRVCDGIDSHSQLLMDGFGTPSGSSGLTGQFLPDLMMY